MDNHRDDTPPSYAAVMAQQPVGFYSPPPPHQLGVSPYSLQQLPVNGQYAVPHQGLTPVSTVVTTNPYDSTTHVHTMLGEYPGAPHPPPTYPDYQNGAQMVVVEPSNTVILQRPESRDKMLNSVCKLFAVFVAFFLIVRVLGYILGHS